MVDTPKAISSPETGWRHVLAASSCKALFNSPGTGGAASNEPMIEKRSRAQRSRLSGSGIAFKKLSQRCAAGGNANGKQAYEPSESLAMSNLCGSCAAITRVDHCWTVKGVRKARSRVIDSAAEAVKRSIRLAGSSVVATGGMKRAQLPCQSGVVGKISAHQVLQR